MASISSIVHIASGSPTPQSLRSKSPVDILVTRAVDAYVDCNDEQKRKLGQGFADAATLAQWTSDHPIDTSSTAYSPPTPEEQHLANDCVQIHSLPSV